MPEEGTRGAVRCQFKVGDKVRVDLETEILKAMQEGHGGWNPRMADVSVQSWYTVSGYAIFLKLKGSLASLQCQFAFH